jgi:hypothetical protein
MEIVSRSSNKVMIVRLPEELYTSLQNNPEKSGTLSFNPLQKLLLLEIPIPDQEPKVYSGRVDDTDEGIHIFAVDSSKKASLKSTVAYKSILTPKISSISERLKQENLNKSSEHEIKLSDSKEDRKNQKKKIFKLHDNHKSFIMANSEMAAQAGLRKKYKEKRVRGDPEKVREQLFELFERQAHWKTKALADETDQPESFLNDILQQIAEKENSGQYRGCWKLKSMFKQDDDGAEPALVKKSRLE